MALDPKTARIVDEARDNLDIMDDAPTIIPGETVPDTPSDEADAIIARLVAMLEERGVPVATAAPDASGRRAAFFGLGRKAFYHLLAAGVFAALSVTGTTEFSSWETLVFILSLLGSGVGSHVVSDVSAMRHGLTK